MKRGEIATESPLASNQRSKTHARSSSLLAIPSDNEVDAKWGEYCDRHHEEIMAARQWHAAADLLPWWAKPGPEYLLADGTMTGSIVDWPAIEGLTPPNRPGVFRQIRPSRTSLEERWTNPGAGPDGRRHLDLALAQLDARKAAQRAEEERLGLPAINRILEQLLAAHFEAKWKVYDLPPVTPMIVAAQLMIDCIENVEPNEAPARSADVETAILRLRNVLPYLSGRLVGDAAIFLGNVEQPFSSEGYDVLYVGN